MAILRFDWKAFDAVAGVKYASGVAIVIALISFVGTVGIAVYMGIKTERAKQ